jgi:predicted dehydrogenase
MTTVIGIGLVGYGGIGRMHALCYRMLPLVYPDLGIRVRLTGVVTASAASAERDRVMRLDVEEFEARGLAQRDPHVYAAACAALEELERLAGAGAPPFCV